MNWHKGQPEAESMRCEVADESVVVMKSRPVKAGNSLEGVKPGRPVAKVDGGRHVPKSMAECEGRKYIRRSLETVLLVKLDTSRLTWRDTLLAAGCERPSADHGRSPK
jgi:hypothetical protein